MVLDSAAGVTRVEKGLSSLPKTGKPVAPKPTRPTGSAHQRRHVLGLRSELASITERYEPQLGSAVAEGRLSRRALRALAVQSYLQEKWPSHIAQVYLALDNDGLADPQVIQYVISIIKAENLGIGSFGLSHTELAKRFANFLGVQDTTLRKARPVPANQVLMDWCDASSLGRHWLDSLAVHLACETQHRTMKAIREGLLKHYAATDGDVLFWTIHGGALERRHAEQATRLLTKHVTPTRRHSVVHVYDVTCGLVRQFYDSFLEG